MSDAPALSAMAFDFGLRRIGVAFGNSVTKTTTPLSVLYAKNGTPTDWTIIDALIEEWQPHQLVVGLPLNMDGSEQSLVAQVKIFAQQLEARYHKPVALFDERLSTIAARERMFEQGGYKAIHKQRMDSIAAQIILESWFAERGRE